VQGRLRPIEGVLRRIEERLAPWREERQAREVEAEAHRDQLWAEAAERERLLVETMEGEESGRRSVGEICRDRKAVFVIHSREAKEALEGLSEEGVRFVGVIAAESATAGTAGLEGSWLIFE
jgi:C4-type Zn-finger protein